MKAKRSELITALDGRFDDHHAELARMLLGQIDALSAQIDTLTARIEQLIAEMDASDHHTGDPGIGQRRAAGHRRTPHRRQATAPTRASNASGGDSDPATVINPRADHGRAAR